MSTTITYNGSTIGQVSNGTKTLLTSGKWLTGNIVLTDSSSGSGGSTLITKTISANGTYNASNDNADGYSSIIVNVPNSFSINDVSNTTGTTAVITGETTTLTTKTITQNGTYSASNDNATGYSQVVVNVSGGGSGTSATQHNIYFEFSDGTNTTIPVYYDDALISTMITSYIPSTYGTKTIVLAELDNVAWYDLSNIPLNTQLIDYTTCTADTALDGDGSEISLEWYYLSDYTPVASGMTFSYITGLWTYIGLYDSNKNSLRVIEVYQDGTPDPNNSNLASGTLSGNKLPSNVAYVRLASTGTNSTDMSLIRTA